MQTIMKIQRREGLQQQYNLPVQMKNENSEEGEGWTDIKRAVLPEEGGTVVTLKEAVPPSNLNANDNKNAEEGGTAATVEASSSNENENLDEGAGCKDINRAVIP